MTEAVQAELDDVARRAFTQERVRHRAALEALRPGDADAIAAEFNRHIDRVNQILTDFGRRVGE